MQHTPFAQELSDFFLACPGMQDKAGRQALLYMAGLDPKLAARLDASLPALLFFQHLIPLCMQYGPLADGRDPLGALLEALKGSVGAERRHRCDDFMRRWREIREQAPAPGSGPEHGGPEPEIRFAPPDRDNQARSAPTSGGVHIGSMRDAVNSTIVGGDLIAAPAPAVTPQEFQQLLAEALRRVLTLAQQREALAAVSPGAPFLLAGAQAALQQAADCLGPGSAAPEAPQIKKYLTEAKTLLQTIAQSAAGFACDALPGLVEQIGQLERQAAQWRDAK